MHQGIGRSRTACPSSPIPVHLPYMLRFTETFCIVVNSIKILESNETPIGGEWLNKLRHIHTMQSLRALKKNAAALQARWWDSPQDIDARAVRWELCTLFAPAWAAEGDRYRCACHAWPCTPIPGRWPLCIYYLLKTRCF